MSVIDKIQLLKQILIVVLKVAEIIAKVNCLELNDVTKNGKGSELLVGKTK